MDGSQLAFVLEQPGAGVTGESRSLYNETGARKRRVHRKTKTGCRNCKQRRLKCDEARPSCGSCFERIWQCEYPSLGGLTRSAQNLSPVSVIDKDCERDTSSKILSTTLALQKDESPAAKSRDLTRRQALAFYEQMVASCRELGDQHAYKRQDIIELLNHFEYTNEPWLGSPISQRMIQNYCLESGIAAPYLLHAVLAISAAHLSFLRPGIKRYSIAATRHYTYSLQAYSKQLARDIDSGNAAEMLAASGLLAKLSFINTPVLSADPLSSVYSLPAWIRSMQGVRTIQTTPRIRAHLAQSRFAHITSQYDGERVPDSKKSPHHCRHGDQYCAMDGLATLCNSGYEDVPNPYASALSRLEPLMYCKPTHDMVDQYLAFIATLESPYLELLKQHDTRALLILVYWTVSLGRIDQWWIKGPARMECQRLCAQLKDMDDPVIVPLLNFLNAACDLDSLSIVP